MKDHGFKRVVLSSLGLALTFGMSHLPAQAASRCDGPTTGGEARACAAAKNGPDTLRRFVERTRMIYGLYYWDFRRVEEEAAIATTRRAELLAEAHTAERADSDR